MATGAVRLLHPAVDQQLMLARQNVDRVLPDVQLCSSTCRSTTVSGDAGVDAQIAADVSDFVARRFGPSYACCVMQPLHTTHPAAQRNAHQLHAGDGLVRRCAFAARRVGITSFVPGLHGAEIEIGVVLAQQPDRNVVALLRQHPDGFARA